jgi:hypothetical protein
LTIVNTNVTTAVTVHFQVYQVVTSSASGGFSCIELFDIVDGLTPGQRYIFDPKNFRRPLSGALVGQATGGRFMMTASAVYLGITTTGLADLRLISFNWLSGQIWMSDVIRASTRGTNAVPRMAVDRLGGPLAAGTLLLGGAGSGEPGAVGCPGSFSCFTGLGVGPTYLQMFRPQILAVNSFFRTASPNGVQQGVPFGNRMTLITFADQYFGTDPFFRLIPASATLTSFIFDDAENPYSITPRPFTCVKEFTIAPDVPGASGNWEDFAGAPLTSAVAATGGWLRMRVSDLASLQSIFGWFSQALGPFGGGDLLIGIGRQAATGLFTTTTAGSGTIVTVGSTQAP